MSISKSALCFWIFHFHNEQVTLSGAGLLRCTCTSFMTLPFDSFALFDFQYFVLNTDHGSPGMVAIVSDFFPSITCFASNTGKPLPPGCSRFPDIESDVRFFVWSKISESYCLSLFMCQCTSSAYEYTNFPTSVYYYFVWFACCETHEIILSLSGHIFLSLGWILASRNEGTPNLISAFVKRLHQHQKPAWHGTIVIHSVQR